MKCVTSNNIAKHIKRNLKDRMFHISTFYVWLHVKIILHVLYTCMFSVYLYGAETWWKIDDVSKQLLLLATKLLKCILCTKNNTHADTLLLTLVSKTLSHLLNLISKTLVHLLNLISKTLLHLLNLIGKTLLHLLNLISKTLLHLLSCVNIHFLKTPQSS